MNEPSVSDQTNHRFAEAVRAYTPIVPRKWHKLLTLKLGIAELRRRGASYQAITEILRAADVPVSRTTVARFCREVLGLKPRSCRARKTDSSRTTKLVMQSRESDMPSPPIARPKDAGGPRI